MPTATSQTEVSSDLSLDELTQPVRQEIVNVTSRQEVALTTKEDQLLRKLITSKQLPGHVKTIEDAFTIGKMGRELGFPIMQAFHFIIPIQGKLTLSAKAIGALMRKNQVTMQTLEDALYVYKDGTTSEYPRPIVDPVTDKPIDRRTTILFTRNGIPEKVSFTWVNATNQELTGRSNWKKMPSEMLWARCLSKGANRIGQDFLLGLYSTDEMFDTFGNDSMQAVRDEDGLITDIITPHEVVTTNVAA